VSGWPSSAQISVTMALTSSSATQAASACETYIETDGTLPSATARRAAAICSSGNETTIFFVLMSPILMQSAPEPSTAPGGDAGRLG
jgi:hypothetical protein